MNAALAIRMTAAFIGWAVALQTLELLGPEVREAFGRGGTWDWRILRTELAPWGFALRPGPFAGLLLLRLLAAAALPFARPPLLAFLCFLLAATTVLICMRWRGTYNGGSDSMTLLILVALGAASGLRDHPYAPQIALGYVALQCILSYFLAGISKLRNHGWRSGQELGRLLRCSAYDVPSRVRRIAGSRALLFAGAWAVLGFECISPAALFSPKLCLIIVAIAALFHLTNAYVLGLNRFFWAWIASYPAVIYFAGTIAMAHSTYASVWPKW